MTVLSQSAHEAHKKKYLPPVISHVYICKSLGLPLCLPCSNCEKELDPLSQSRLKTKKSNRKHKSNWCLQLWNLSVRSNTSTLKVIQQKKIVPI